MIASTLARINYLTIIILFSFAVCGVCQENNGHKIDGVKNPANQVYFNRNFHEVPEIEIPENWNSDGEVKNVILMIGDGMGATQISAAAMANHGNLHIMNFTHTGFGKTSASDNEITDSAAGATALACGIKTNNGAIGVDYNGEPVESILEKAEHAGLATGLVATCRITHATPASFIAHQPNRYMYEEIALDFIKTDIDVFIGGGRNNFSKRNDEKDLLDVFTKNGYEVITKVKNLEDVEKGKLAGLIHEENQSRYSFGRGKMLEKATRASLNILSQDPDGFFLMIEGSQIDWAGHNNDTGYLIEEMLDFDRSVGIVMEFALENPGTLVIITADHETGGFSVLDVNNAMGKVQGSFATTHHTGIMVPVYAFGPQAERFTGIYENTEIFFKMKAALGF